MNVTRCDICKKEIKGLYEDSAEIRMGFDHYEFCKDCNVPILEFLEKVKKG